MDSNPDTAKAFFPKDIIDYSPGAVVSKTIVKKTTGNVTLFAFDKGEGLAEHSTPHDALVHIVDGEADINIGGTFHNLCTGQCIIMPADIPHSLKANERFKMMLTMIRS